MFLNAHDPTQLNRQGNDVGRQYRSAIFYADETERGAAEAKIAKLNESNKFSRPIATTLEPLVTFYAAETYHQGYAGLHPDEPYIMSQAYPKACKIRDKYSKMIREAK